MRAILDHELARTDQRLEITHEMSTSLSARRLVKEGIGFTFTDVITLSPEEAQGLAVRRWHPRVNIEFGYFTAPNNRHHKARDAFIEVLKEICAARL